MRRLYAVLGLFALVATPGSLFAQDLADICGDLQSVEAGDWAEYQMTTPEGTGTVRLAMLAEGASGEAGTWMEMSGEFGGQSSIIQLLVDGYPYEPGEVQAVVMKMGGQPAMRLPESMLTQMRGQMQTPVGDISEACNQSELLGEESVSVPAGTFDAYHVRPSAELGGDDVGEVWVSKDVPFGLVKTTGQQGSMVLLAAGTDATSSIDETPTEMPGMGGMGGP